MENSPDVAPLSVTPAIVSGAVPVLLTVTAWVVAASPADVGRKLRMLGST